MVSVVVIVGSRLAWASKCCSGAANGAPFKPFDGVWCEWWKWIVIWASHTHAHTQRVDAELNIWPVCGCGAVLMWVDACALLCATAGKVSTRLHRWITAVFFPWKNKEKVSIWPMHTRPIWCIMYKHSFLSSSVVFHLINLRLRQSTKTRHNRNKSEAAHFALNEWFNIVRLIIYIYICILPNFNDGLWIFR